MRKKGTTAQPVPVGPSARTAAVTMTILSAVVCGEDQLNDSGPEFILLSGRFPSEKNALWTGGLTAPDTERAPFGRHASKDPRWASTPTEPYGAQHTLVANIDSTCLACLYHKLAYLCLLTATY